MKQIIGRKIYDTATSVEVASNHYWDGSYWDRGGTNTFLYKTKKGNFFLHHTTRWQGGRDQIEPVGIDEAKDWYEELPEHSMDFEEAFGVAPEEA